MGCCICCPQLKKESTRYTRLVPVSDGDVKEKLCAPESETVYEYTGDTKASTSVVGAVGGAAVGWIVGGPLGAVARGGLGYVAGHMAGGPVEEKVVRKNC